MSDWHQPAIYGFVGEDTIIDTMSVAHQAHIFLYTLMCVYDHSTAVASK